jgi:hypothetical protein
VEGDAWGDLVPAGRRGFVEPQGGQANLDRSAVRFLRPIRDQENLSNGSLFDDFAVLKLRDQAPVA